MISVVLVSIVHSSVVLVNIVLGAGQYSTR